jgi:uncharacterized protein YggT (Ycf19 family)
VWLLKLVQYAMLMSLLASQRWSVLLLLALLGVGKLAVSVGTAIVIVAAVMSWMQNRTLLTDVLERLAEPMLAPLRRVIPLVGGIDLSPCWPSSCCRCWASSSARCRRAAGQCGDDGRGVTFRALAAARVIPPRPPAAAAAWPGCWPPCRAARGGRR